MKVKHKKRTYKLTTAGKLVVGLTVLIAILITTTLYAKSGNQAIKQDSVSNLYLTNVSNEIEKLMDIGYEMYDQVALKRLESLDHIYKDTDILLTNYWSGDGSSGTTTASGLKVSDFEVNEDGLYTYNGKIVVATANVSRLNKPIRESYKSHNLFDELELTFNNKPYTGVVLDVCGACFGVDGEELQRYDIFATNNVIGKVRGTLHE